MIKKICRLLIDEDDSSAKAAFYYLICNVLIHGIGFLTTPIFSRLLSKSEYGIVSNFFAINSILFIIFSLDLRVTINRSKYLYPDDNDTYLSTIVSVGWICTAIAYIIFELNSKRLSDLLNLNPILFRLLFVYILFQIPFNFQQVQYNIYRKYKLYVFYTIINTVANITLSLLLVLLMRQKELARIIGMVIPSAIIGGIIAITIYRRGRSFFVPSYARFAIKAAIPLLPSALAGTLLSSSDRTMISYYCGSEETAMYSIPYAVSSIASIFWTALNQAWGPWYLDHLSTKKYDEIRIFSKKFSMVYVILVIGLMVISPEVVLFIGGRRYIDTVSVMPPVILSMVFTFFYAFYFDIEYFFGETYIISLGTMLGAIVNIGLNVVLIPRRGYIAAAYTTAIGYFVMLLYHYAIVRFRLRKAFILDNKFFVMLLVLVIGLQVIIAMTYEYFAIRYSMLVIYLVVVAVIAWKEKELLLSLAKRILPYSIIKKF